MTAYKGRDNARFETVLPMAAPDSRPKLLTGLLPPEKVHS